ncbi:MAG: hypothetical protein KA354_19360 [Phycisphaerae bacterium]|nr:hypothetical protein [Phycisphaerae bacterium]
MVSPRDEYTEDAVQAARQVMLELIRILGEYRDCLVVVGGWVPELVLAAAGAAHIGSNDVDLALDHRKLTEGGRIPHDS